MAIRFARDDPQPHQNSHTFFLSDEGPLPAMARPKEVKVDITKREEIVFPLESRKVLRAYEEYADLPEDAEIPAYSLMEIAAEKVVALLDQARNEPVPDVVRARCARRSDARRREEMAVPEQAAAGCPQAVRGEGGALPEAVGGATVGPDGGVAGVR